MKDGENESYHEWLKRTDREEVAKDRRRPWVFVARIYGGFFGVVLGIAMLARCVPQPPPEPLAGVAKPLPRGFPYESEIYMAWCLSLNGSGGVYLCSLNCRRTASPEKCRAFGDAYDQVHGNPAQTKRFRDEDAEYFRQHPEESDHL